jgi:hypothetical protein
MKQILLSSLFLVGLIVNVFATNPIWTCPLTTGQPIYGNYYVGDYVNPSGTWYFQFVIGQTSWNESDVGIGQNSDGVTGWTWSAAFYDYNISGTSNDVVQTNIAGFQFTNSGIWYVSGRAQDAAGESFSYPEDSVWSATTTFPAGFCAYFTVNALVAPSNQSAVASQTGGDTILLGWTPPTTAQTHKVMVVRFPSGDYTAPVNGTSYAVGSGLGSGTIVYNGIVNKDTIDAGLASGTSFDYYYYAQNNNYYSATGFPITVTTPTSTTTGLSSLTIPGVKIITATNMLTVLNNGSMSIQLFSINGSLMDNANVTNQYTKQLPAGLYVLKVNGDTSKVMIP